MEMGDEELVFGDRQCNFVMKFWNVTLSEEIYGGIRVKFENLYSRKHLRFYVTDKPIG